eukprot:NODE_663_length_4918_cov_0.396140.p3 type:complete len:183 gc:universal NODE_663_length_4918_cov_0.396140:2425-1877(-)
MKFSRILRKTSENDSTNTNAAKADSNANKSDLDETRVASSEFKGLSNITKAGKRCSLNLLRKLRILGKKEEVEFTSAIAYSNTNSNAQTMPSDLEELKLISVKKKLLEFFLNKIQSLSLWIRSKLDRLIWKFRRINRNGADVEHWPMSDGPEVPWNQNPVNPHMLTDQERIFLNKAFTISMI